MKSSEGKKNYSKEFENMLGNPIEQVDRLIKQAHNLITDRGGATTKVSREGATLKHTAKVRPLTIKDPKWTGVCKNIKPKSSEGKGIKE